MRPEQRSRLLGNGATRYIGGRIITRLLKDAHEVRVLVRDAGRARSKPWFDRVTVMQRDLFGRSTPAELCVGIDAAYYLGQSRSPAGS
ncbi:MAG: NAD(P)H-binding protein [Planctomycetes bacterium]|nr:NAD(P)H-binding protein [Planctomycetota bacterium]